jgi:hypothetical protein
MQISTYTGRADYARGLGIPRLILRALAPSIRRTTAHETPFGDVDDVHALAAPALDFDAAFGATSEKIPAPAAHITFER